ncbi:hypothetical protein GWO43_24710 [candidate division KSB1 bacterium]|nr:hypothetical protein [candidate division KSB1 bacterium]NIR68643.1 hypothetical protein [candidate division KSB1 bacterium]NIS27132.1 hypothetical protein [candidate division KSB1 bacterium]NIT74018.1 hypothetical protein [candidate division KSB1 bacterium]NIU27884.1 hypothetical protein [candidate division KSB1 bacterium]
MKQKKYKIVKVPKKRRLIREQIAGFKRMNEFVREEQRQELPEMTPEESKEIFEGLWMMWENTKKQYPDYKKLDRIRIQELVGRKT